MLLSSHFERYLYNVNDEIAAWLNASGITGDRLPEPLRLLHSQSTIDRLADMAWQKRAGALSAFVTSEGWLWSIGAAGSIEPRRLLAWLKAPKPDRLVRYTKYWGIDNIFHATPRKQHTRSRLYLLVTELVEKRNSIAHGEFSAEATRSDVARYSATVLNFCKRADRVAIPTTP